MAYDKPIEIKVTSQNTNGTEVSAVKLLDTIEKQLKTVLKEGDLFKSPKASVDYSTHDVTKSFFVRRDAEKIVRDIINLKKDIFYKEPSITSSEAKTRRYRMDVEGERAIAALKADVSAIGGHVYGNQHGTYAEIPSYKGSYTSATANAKKYTASYRDKEENELVKLLVKEEKEAKKQTQQRLKDEAKEAEKKQKQEEKEAEKEERQKETERKQRSIALIAGMSASVLLLKKLISLVENITTSVIEQGQKSFETSMTAQRLNISPDLLRKLEYAGMAKGIGSAPINAMLSLQDSFGSTLLAAENINKLKNIMPIIGADVEKLILNGSVGTNPLGMKTMLMNRLLKANQEGSDGLGGKVSKEASNAALTSLARSALGDDFAMEFSRAAMDDATDYTAWLIDSMPVSAPSYNALNASSENYEQYTEALTEFKAAIDVLLTSWSPLLNKLTVALETLTLWIMKLTGDKEGIAKFSEKNYKQAQESYARDYEANEKAYRVRAAYAVRNEDKFGGVAAAMTATTDFLDSGILPYQLEGDEEGIREFLAMVLNASLSRQLEANLKKSRKAKADYESGEELLSFADTGLSQTADKAYKAYKAAAWEYYESRLEAEKLETIETPDSLKEEDEAVLALGLPNARKYMSTKKAIEDKQAEIDKESAKGTKASQKKIKKAQEEIDELNKKNKDYEERLTEFRETNPLGGASDADISSTIAKELMYAAIKEMVIQTTFGGPLPAGFSYRTHTDPNQTGILYIQLLDAQGKEQGERMAVPAHLAGPFNETMPYAMQGD